MSSWHDELSYRMRPMSKAEIAERALEWLKVLQPKALTKPTPVDLLPIVDHELQRIGVHVYPATPAELPDSEAEVNPMSDPVTLLIREDQWNMLLDGGSLANRPRATVAHEIGHTALHIRQMKARAALGTLQRMSRRRLQAFEDSEWQAWAFAGCLLMPPQTLRLLGSRDPDEVAAVYQVSVDFAAQHLRRYGA